MPTFSATAENCANRDRRALARLLRTNIPVAARRVHHPFRAVLRALLGAMVAVAAAHAHADSIKIGGTGTGLGAMKLLAQEYRKSRPGAQLTIAPSLGSTGAIKAVLANAVDVGISARPLSAEERRQGASAQAYARTPFVLATSSKNKLAGLSLHQLAQITAGEVTTWPDGSAIRLVVRPDSDADTLALRTFSAEMDRAITAAMQRKGLKMATTDQDNADALEQLPGSLGMTTLTQIITEDRALRPLALDGVTPTLQALAAGEYRYFKTLHLVTGAKPSPLAKDFVAFVRSPAGQAVLARSGNLALAQ
jgi:phosphate transport system substrate-binding protein